MRPRPTSRKCGARRTCARTPRPSSSEAGGGAGPSALGLEREAHADRAEAAVDVEDLSGDACREVRAQEGDRKSTRLNSSHSQISYAVFCLKKKKKTKQTATMLSKLPRIGETIHQHAI